MYGFSTEEANEMLSKGKYEELIEGIVTKYKYLEENYDFVLCEGTDFEGSTSAFEFDINADIANNLGCPVVLSANAYTRRDVINLTLLGNKKIRNIGICFLKHRNLLFGVALISTHY